VPNMSIDELLQSGVSHAKHVLIGEEGAQIIPCFIIQFKDRPPAILATPWTNDKEKWATREAVRLSLKHFYDSVDSYMFWTEAWMATENIHHPSGLMPSDREDKREVVVINAFDKQNERVCVLEIVRGDDGRVTNLVEDKTATDTTFWSGAMHNLLKDDRQ
jgi:hypothetical protein